MLFITLLEARVGSSLTNALTVGNHHDIDAAIVVLRPHEPRLVWRDGKHGTAPRRRTGERRHPNGALDGGSEREEVDPHTARVSGR